MLSINRPTILYFVISLATVLFVLPAAAAGVTGQRQDPDPGPDAATGNPDFTRGDTIPEGADHVWNRGATGACGWMFSDRLVTTDAGQIAITEVEQDSPGRRGARHRRRDSGRRRQTVFL